MINRTAFGMCAAVVLAIAAAEPAWAQQQCPSGVSYVTSAKIRLLPVYSSRDLATPVQEYRGKTRDNSLSWPILRCLTNYYVVQVPGIEGPLYVRKDEVDTNAAPVDDRPFCDSNAPIMSSGAQNRSGMSSGGPTCRPRP